MPRKKHKPEEIVAKLRQVTECLESGEARAFFKVSISTVRRA